MARSNIARRHAAERARIEALDAVLRQVSAVARPAPDFDNAIREAAAGFRHEAIRSAEAWRPKLKTRDAAKLRLAAARHLYARYAVPACLEAIWADTDGMEAAEIELRKRWYIVAARGGSLYKAGASEWLSRKEVHLFLNAPDTLSFDEAFWNAVARTYTEDAGAALRIARSKVARQPRAQLAFWREAARFFAVNPAPLETIDDLCDYMADSLRRDRRYSLKGRTLGSLQRQMQEWHRDVEAMQRIERMRQLAEAGRAGSASDPQGGRWAGARMANWTWQPSSKEARCRGETFDLVQLTSGAELLEESRAMHHCVWTYAGKCVTGHASIWSLRRKVPGARPQRLLTIELDRASRAVQVRGFGNRIAQADEQRILERWAKARGVVLIV